MIAKIAVSAATFAIDKPYSYQVPAQMALQEGMRVIVRFGRSNRRVEGIVLALAQEDDRTELKTVEECLDEQPALSGQMLRLAAFMRERYFCTFYDAARAMLPAGLWYREQSTFALTQDVSWQEQTVRQKDALAILRCLRDAGGQAQLSQLREAVPDEAAFEKAIAYLRRKKWITAQTDFLRRTGDKTEKIAVLAVPAEEAMDYASRRPRSAAMQREVLQALCTVGTVSVKELCYFTGAKIATIRRLESLGLLRLEEKPVLRCREIRPSVPAREIELNEEQSAAFFGLREKLDAQNPGVALLYGVTGSGKTSIYLKLIRCCMERQKTAMLLVPEIALTPQLLGVLAAYFGDQVAVLHSSLSAAERYDQWKRVRAGQSGVVVGTRSAVFAPCPRLGMIILDEEQEHSYQSENAPRYAAKEIAIWRGAKEGALVLLGSATPSVETMYRAKCADYALFTLKNRYNGRPLPSVQIVDMREQLKSGNELSLSYPLQDAIRATAGAGKQTILFLNRRGNSRALVCVDCARSPECPRCNARLTYHSANERLMCHYCGFSQSVTRVCPHCGGSLKRVGTGTQKVEQELHAVLPSLAVARMDADTVSATNPHEKILERFRSERVPILVGTQMVAKGLDLPDVTLVGVLDADLSLYADGYRAAQTTFNMLTQVVGRAGRGDAAGHAVIQTMAPEHKVITLAAQQDYDGFYALEIALRRAQGAPPFADLPQIIFTGQDEAQILRAAVKFRDSLRACLLEPAYAGERCTVLGPAPCPVPKINYNYRYRLTLRCTFGRRLRQLVASLLRQSALDRDNRGINVFADPNGID